MTQSKKAVKSVLIIILLTLSSKVFGFIREMLIAAKFGSGIETDIFFIAHTAITLFTAMITKSLNNTMIPVLSQVESTEGKTGKGKYTNNLLNITIIMSFFIVFIAWALAPLITKILATGFEGEQFKLTILMVRIGLPAIIFASIQGVFRGYLQSEHMFIESAAAQYPLNFVYIFYLLFLTNIFEIKGLMVISVFAVASQIILQIPGVRGLGYRYNFTVDFKDKYIKKVFYLIPPILVSATINDINNVIDKSMASTLIDGSVSALNYANRLNGLIQGIFVAAITTVIYPMLSQEANKDSLDGLKKTTMQGINIILLITIPSTIGMIILANPIVRLAFERGAFDTTATYMTTGALVFYSLGIINASMNSLIYRTYYSLQETKTPMMNAIFASSINIVLNFVFIRFMAHNGLALATSISTLASSMFLLYNLKKKIGSFGFSGTIKCGLKSLLASIIMGVIVYFLYGVLAKNLGSSNIQELISLIISVGTGVIIYSLLIYLFKIKEVDWVINLAKEKLSKSKS